MFPPSRKRRPCWFEQLEPRQLLSVDLSVRFATQSVRLIGGRHVSYDIDITSAGTDAGQAALFEHTHTGLDNLRWYGGWTRGRLDSEFSSPDELLAGEGPISLGVEVPANTTMRFRVAGDVRDAVDEKWTANTLISPRDVDIRDVDNSNNRIVRTGFIQETHFALDSVLERPDGPLVPGEQASYRFHVSNNGRRLSSVRVFDPASHLLDNVTWTRAENTYSADIYLADDHDPNTAWRWRSESTLLDGSAGFVLEAEGEDESCCMKGPITGDLMGGHDLNADGVPDVVVGGKGEVYVVFGTSEANLGRLSTYELNGSTGVLIAGIGAPGLQSNTRVALLPDFNGDGFDDLLLARDGDATAAVLFGGPDFGNQPIDVNDLSPSQGMTIIGLPVDDLSQTVNLRHVLAVSSAGDVNQDGLGDVLIGHSRMMDENGRAFVVFGSSRINESASIDLRELDGSNGFSILGDRKQALGQVVAGGTDLNGDGIDDILVADLRRAYVLFGATDVGSDGSMVASDLTPDNGVVLSGVFPGNATTLGDFDGDSIHDILIGDPRVSGQATSQFRPDGAGYVVYGGATLTAKQEHDLRELDGEFGFSLTGGATRSGTGVAAIDVNADGFDDIAIGARPWSKIVDRWEGPHSEIQVVLGQPRAARHSVSLNQLNGLNGFSIHNLMHASRSNAATQSLSITGIGDFNGDGMEDFAFDAPAISVGFSESVSDGDTYFIFGRKPLVSHGVGNIMDTIDIPEYSGVTYTVTGTVPIGLTEFQPSPSVRPAASVSLQLTNFPDWAYPDDTIEYDIEVRSSVQAPDVQVKDTLADQLEDVAWVQQGGFVPAERTMRTMPESEAVFVDPLTAEMLYAEAQDEFDFNGDGFPDQAVVFEQQGVAYPSVRFGVESGLQGESIAFDLPPIHLQGDMVALDDVNGDGIDDVLISAYRYSRDRGAVFVVFGNRAYGDERRLNLLELEGIRGYRIVGENRTFATHAGDPTGDGLGRRILRARDVNEDGLGDFLVWAAVGGQGGDDDGVLLVYGKATSTTGVGAVDTTMDVAAESPVIYTVTGRIPTDVPPRLAGAMEVVTSDRQVDLDPHDNRVEVSLATSLDGDIDGNRAVDFEDFLILQAHFGMPQLATRAQGDLDGDGRVAFSDFVILSANYGRGQEF